MRQLFFLIALVHTTLSYSQDIFVFTEDGLYPEYAISKIDGLSQNKLYNKTLGWVYKTYKNPNVVISSKSENHFIFLTSLEENVINADKRVFHMRYTIKISFNNEQFKFEPIKIQFKANSKYDMGWKDFDLKNGAIFFKKGKVIKKTKSYVIDVPKVLNKLNTNLCNYLTAEVSN